MSAAAATDGGRVPASRAAVLLVLLAGLLWAAVEWIGRAFPPGTYTLYQIVWVRYATHILFMLIAVAPRRKTRLVRTRRVWMQLGRGMLMLGMPVCFVLSVGRLPVDDVWSIFWVAPLMSLALAGPVLGERVGARTWIVAATAFVGALMMIGPRMGVLRWAEVLPLAMAGCFGLYAVLSRALRSEDLSANLFYTALAVLIPVSVIIPFVWRTPTPADMLLMASIGLLGLCFLWALDRACELAPVAMLAPYFFLEPLWDVVGHALWRGESPGLTADFGALVLIGALLIGFVTWTSQPLGRPSWWRQPPPLLWGRRSGPVRLVTGGAVGGGRATEEGEQIG